MTWAGHIASVDGRDAYKILVGKPEGEIVPGRPRSRWEDNIKMVLEDIVFEYVDGIHLTQIGSSGELS
jgi:hypothetical protein